jgi:hypothetical protein
MQQNKMQRSATPDTGQMSRLSRTGRAGSFVVRAAEGVGSAQKNGIRRVRSQLSAVAGGEAAVSPELKAPLRIVD